MAGYRHSVARRFQVENWTTAIYFAVLKTTFKPGWLTPMTKANRSSESHSLARRFIIIIIINPLTARVVGAPQIILQPVFSSFPCSPLPCGTCRTPGLLDGSLSNNCTVRLVTLYLTLNQPWWLYQCESRVIESQVTIWVSTELTSLCWKRIFAGVVAFPRFRGLLSVFTSPS